MIWSEYSRAEQSRATATATSTSIATATARASTSAAPESCCCRCCSCTAMPQGSHAGRRRAPQPPRSWRLRQRRTPPQSCRGLGLANASSPARSREGSYPCLQHRRTTHRRTPRHQTPSTARTVSTTTKCSSAANTPTVTTALASTACLMSMPVVCTWS
jgi:hypothetical protein